MKQKLKNILDKTTYSLMMSEPYGHSDRLWDIIEINEKEYEGNLDKIIEFMNQMPFGEDYIRLADVKGQAKYHKEGNALIHTILVAAHCYHLMDEDWFFTLGLLHDIGKIYTGIPKNDGTTDWEYPYHSVVGGIPGILQRFIPKKDPMFMGYSWFITNHIKPLFWINKSEEEVKAEIEALEKSVPKDIDGHSCIKRRCTVKNLILLVLADLYGSIGEESNWRTIDYLSELYSMSENNN